MNQISQSNLSSKSKQLRQIKDICSQGRQINNMQIRSILTSIVYNLQILFDTQPKNQQNLTKTIQLEQTIKGQYSRQDIETELNNITNTMIKKNSLLDQKIEKISNNLLMQLQKQRKSTEENIQKQLSQLNGNIKYKFKNLEDIFLKQLKKQTIILNKRIEQLREEISYLSSNKIVQKVQKVKPIQLKQEKQQIMAIDWVDSQFCQYQNLQLNGNKITVKAWTDIYGKNFNSPIFSFTIFIDKFEGKKMAIGVVDSKLKTKIKQTNQSNQVYYHSSGFLWDGMSKRNVAGYNKGYVEKQTIKVIVDLKQGIIQWKTQDEVRCILKNDKLKNKDIKWVPFIYLGQKGDSVNIVG